MPLLLWIATALLLLVAPFMLFLPDDLLLTMLPTILVLLPLLLVLLDVDFRFSKEMAVRRLCLLPDRTGKGRRKSSKGDESRDEEGSTNTVYGRL